MLRIFYALVFLIVWFNTCSFASSGDYSRSVHGDGSTTLWSDSPAGVKRSSLPAYKEGNCAHCHEQHSSIAGVEPDEGAAGTGPDKFLLFSVSDSTATASNYGVEDNFCFQCHSDSSVQYGGITNYDYSGTFAGFTGSSGSGGATPTSIMAAFNKTHSHDLKDVYNHALANFSWFKSGSNACTACHNPHLVQRNTKIVDSTGNLQTVMSIPSAHSELYGDVAGETMAIYSSQTIAGYVAPNGEPSVSQTPDYNTFCLSCHAQEVTVTSTRPYYHGKDESTILAIDWVTVGSPDGDSNQTGTFIDPGDKHGRNAATAYAAVESPFNVNGASDTPGDIVLSCMNCHEAHGSENDYMHRRSINNTPLGVVITGETNERGSHCIPCHTEDTGGNKWKETHHGGVFVNDNPYVANDHAGCDYCHGGTKQADADFPIPCEDCHFHGSYVDEFDKYTPEGIARGVKYVTPDKPPYRRKTF